MKLEIQVWDKGRPLGAAVVDVSSSGVTATSEVISQYPSLECGGEVLVGNGDGCRDWDGSRPRRGDKIVTRQGGERRLIGVVE